MLTFIDLELAHIAKVMAASMTGNLAGPILSGDYWRSRLHWLLDSQHLTNAQLRELDRLLLQLDDLETQVAHQAARSAAISVF
jgi:hypothetical protein